MSNPYKRSYVCIDNKLKGTKILIKIIIKHTDFNIA